MSAPRQAHLGISLDGSPAEVTDIVASGLLAPHGEDLELVLPLHHRRLDALFTAYVIVRPRCDRTESAARVDGLARTLSGLASVRRLDHLELQDGLDLFYPMRGGVRAEGRLLQAIEYVRSRPEARSEYYPIQTRFSGPAMRSLHARDLAGRFIGFEVVGVIESETGMPDWDVIHVSGFRPWQAIKAIPHFRAAFEKAAHAIGEPSGRAIIKGWDEQREKRTVRVRQLAACTVSSERLETGRS